MKTFIFKLIVALAVLFLPALLVSSAGCASASHKDTASHLPGKDKPQPPPPPAALKPVVPWLITIIVLGTVALGVGLGVIFGIPEASKLGVVIASIGGGEIVASGFTFIFISLLTPIFWSTVAASIVALGLFAYAVYVHVKAKKPTSVGAAIEDIPGAVEATIDEIDPHLTPGESPGANSAGKTAPTASVPGVTVAPIETPKPSVVFADIEAVAKKM